MKSGQHPTGEVHEDQREAGFTLIELLVVIVVIGILASISIPAYAGIRTMAQDRAAQAELMAGYRGVNIMFLQEGLTRYPIRRSEIVTAMESVMPELDWGRWGQRNKPAKTILLRSRFSGRVLQMRMKSESGDWFCIIDVKEATRGLEVGPYFFHNRNCRANGWE